MNKILITGGAGYIGSVLTEQLLREGFEVTILDNFMYSDSSLNHLHHYEKLRIIKGDARDKRKVLDCLKTADVIIPLAAYVGAPLCEFDPVGARTINNDAIDIIFNNVSIDQWILMPTTNSAYGSGDENNYCDENSPLNPISNYAIEKVEVEKKLLNHNNFISFRLATVFGMSPRMRVDLLVNDFVLRACYDKYLVLFEGHFKRNYIHVRDVSKAFLHGIKNFKTMKQNIYNVGLSTANLSKIELCEKIKNHIEGFVYFEEKLQKDKDQRNYIVSNKKIEKTGFLPSFSIDDGIKELIKGYTSIKVKNNSNI